MTVLLKERVIYTHFWLENACARSEHQTEAAGTLKVLVPFTRLLKFWCLLSSLRCFWNERSCLHDDFFPRKARYWCLQNNELPEYPGHPNSLQRLPYRVCSGRVPDTPGTQWPAGASQMERGALRGHSQELRKRNRAAQFRSIHARVCRAPPSPL